MNMGSEVSSEGTVIHARYRVLGTLGAGGMGRVYRVRDQATDRELALKALKASKSREAGRLRFRREFHTLAQLRHPGIVEVYDYGHHEGAPFYTMEYLPGCDLSQLRSPLPAERLCRLLRQVAETLAFLHTRRLLHRDIAARNIRLYGGGGAKLIDFGIMTTVNALGELVGTPPYMAPESAQRLPLDAGVDLFGLGALAYRLLTGRHAYPARRFEELPTQWRLLPAAPSRLAGGVPQELDELVLSLLAVDRLRRPRSMAEVLERLDAVLGDSSTPHRRSARQYLTRTTLVGRTQELAALRDTVRGAAAGRSGSVLLFEGPVGSGKSRLLQALGLEAQLSGALTLVARPGESGRRAPYETLRELTQGLFAAAPKDALAAAAGYVKDLALLPFMAVLLGVRPTAVLRDTAEQRVRVQAAFGAWLLAVAQNRPLVLLVDSAEVSDEASIGVLVALAEQVPRQPLIIALCCATDQPFQAERALRALRRLGTRLRLTALSEGEVEQWVVATFGEVSERKRLAGWLYKVASGSPLHTLELARQLVYHGVLRYDGGMWLVSRELHDKDAPHQALVDALAQELGGLAEAPRKLAEALSVYEGELTLEMCARLAGAKDERELFGLLDDLVRRDILVGRGGGFRFRHEALRQAMQRGLDRKRKTRLHLAVGHALLALDMVEDREDELGWHLVCGGAELAGARWLEVAARKRFYASSFRDAIGPLQRALDVHERSGAPPHKLLKLRFRLLVCGSAVDRDVAMRYAEPVVHELAREAGLDVTHAMPAAIRPALPVGLAVAAVRRLLRPAKRRGNNPLKALTMLFLALERASVSSYHLNDSASLTRWIRLAEPAASGPRGELRQAFLSYMRVMRAHTLGQWPFAREEAQRALSLLRAATMPRTIETFVRAAETGLRLLVAMMSAGLESRRFADDISEVERAGLPMFDGHVTFVRALHHRLRGEETWAAHFDDRAELIFLRWGSSLGSELRRPVLNALGYTLSRDVIGLKRCLEDLSRLQRAGGSFEDVLELTRGEYLRERVDLDASESTLRRSLAMSRSNAMRQTVHVALAETLLAQGRADAAQREAEQACHLSRDPMRAHDLIGIRGQRVGALALAAGGDYDAARSQLQRLGEETEILDNPLVAGMLHEALATVSLLAADSAGYQRHSKLTERFFGETGNPALLARVQRFASGRPLGERNAAQVVGEAVTAVATTGVEGDLMCRTIIEPSESRAHDAWGGTETASPSTG